MILKNQNDIYIYFETIEQLEPKRVLDIGMLLKRAGSVSRKIMAREVPEETWLDGIDFFPEICFPVWDRIYNRIVNPEQFLKEKPKDVYGLAVLLGVETVVSNVYFSKIMKKLPECTRYLLTNRILDMQKMDWPKVKIIDLQVEQDAYFLLDFGVEQHGYQNICNDT